MSTHCERIAINDEDIVGLAGYDCRTDGPQLAHAICRMLPTMGKFVTNMLVDYGMYAMDSASAAIVSRAVRQFCPNMVRLHVQNASPHYRRQNEFNWPQLEMVTPAAAELESFVYTDVHFDGKNHDDQIVSLVGDRCNRLESLAVYRSCFRGDCLQYMTNLVYLKVHSCVFMPQRRYDSAMRPFRLRQLRQWTQLATVSHLDLRQDVFTHIDVKTMFLLPRLKFLDLHVDAGTTRSVNKLLRAVLKFDRILHFNVEANPLRPYEIERRTVQRLLRTKKLVRIHLKDCAGGGQIRLAFRVLRHRNPKFRYKLN